MCKEKPFIMQPKVDFCFKELLEDKEIRCGFISALLQIPPEAIRSTTLINTHLRKMHKKDKLGILDVRVQLEDGTEMNVEMQSLIYDYWTERSLFYLCKMYTDQIHEGDDYKKLKKCIHVGILDFTLFDDKEYYSRFHIREDTRPLLYSDKLEIHILELPKLRAYKYPQTELLRWAQFFNAEDREELKMIAKGNKFMEKAYKHLVELSADKEKRMEYEARQKALRDQLHIRNSGFRAGHAEGHAEGLTEGYTKGLEDGEHQFLTKQIQKKLVKNPSITPLEIAEELETPIEVIQKIIAELSVKQAK